MLHNFVFDYRYKEKNETLGIPAPTLACAERMLRINATKGRAREMVNIEITSIRCEPIAGSATSLGPVLETKDMSKPGAMRKRATKKR